MLLVNLFLLFSNLEYFLILLRFFVTNENLRILETQALGLYHFAFFSELEKFSIQKWLNALNVENVNVDYLVQNGLISRQT